MRFPAKKNAGCPKAPCDFPPRNDGIICPRRVVLGLPSPSHRVCGRTDVRMYGCTDVRTDGHVTSKSQPKFLGLIGYHISLTELNNALRMFVTSVLSSLVPRAAILSASATDRSSGLWKICE